LCWVSVRRHLKFADGFFQIPNRLGHPCHSRMLPISSAHAGTCILLAYYHARHTKKRSHKYESSSGIYN
jgi:hypothetical protein